MRRTRAAVGQLFVAAIVLVSGTPVTAIAGTAPTTGQLSRTTLDVDGDRATIVRDDFGVPHIFAATNRGLFVAYGFTVAQDRLWQLELNRRAARGRLAELFGSSALASDRIVRTLGYTEAELDAQFSIIGPEEQDIFRAYRDGINRYLTEVVLPDPLHKLPFEFHALGITPAPWELRDSVAFGAFMTRRFGEIGGRHLQNQALFDALIARFGRADGMAIFNDVRWINDPDAPVTVPVEEPVGERERRSASRRPGAAPLREAEPAQLEAGLADSFDREEAEAKAMWERLGVATRLGSYAWVVSPNNAPMGSPCSTAVRRWDSALPKSCTRSS